MYTWNEPEGREGDKKDDLNKTTRMEGQVIPIMSTKNDRALAKLLRKLFHVVCSTLEAVVPESILGCMLGL